MEMDISKGGPGVTGSDTQQTGPRYRTRYETETEDTTVNARPSELAPPSGTAATTTGSLGRHVLLGLSVAGFATSALTTIFDLFHVQLFLKSYQLPYASYSLGSFIVAVVSTFNSVAGAWMVDHIAVTMSRSDLVGTSGCLFAMGFLTPFFRWHQDTTDLDESVNIFGLAHFIFSMSLYHTLYSFTTILTGSLVTDDYHMTDKARIQYMASGKIANLIGSFVVARVGLRVFQEEDLALFRLFLLVLAILVSLLFFFAQIMIMGERVQWQALRLRRNTTSPSEHSNTGTTTQGDTTPKLQWRKIVHDFWNQRNFRVWIVMEMLLEAQVAYSSSFLKTFVDGLLLESGVSRARCDWILSMYRPIMEITTICAYVPIRVYGYPNIYFLLFAANIILTGILMLCATPTSTSLILLFLVIYPAMSGAVQASGFYLAISDLVMERKRHYAMEGRHDEPSLAGLFMGATALVSRPVGSLLPIMTATVLGNGGSSRKVLYHLLVLPPFFCSIIQLAVWRTYTLTPKRTASMRDELQKIHDDLVKLVEI